VVVAPLKSRRRVVEKAGDDYKARLPPTFAWVYDVVRASVICADEASLVQVRFDARNCHSFLLFYKALNVHEKLYCYYGVWRWWLWS
jgi:hypothetical protein